jgi:hypothetical protein
MVIVRKLARRVLRAPSPATVIAMLALLVATAGTAWGVAPQSLRSSHGVATRCPSNPSISINDTRCHTPTYNSVDIIDNTLQSRDIKNGTLKTGDFSRSTLNALHGQTGQAGPAGPGGPAGVAGAQGPPGPVRLAYASSGSLDNPPHTQSPGTATCPAGGYYAVGGGVVSESLNPGEQQVNSSYPLPSSGTSNVATSWRAYVDNTSATDYSFAVYVICTQPSIVTGKSTAAVAAKR